MSTLFGICGLGAALDEDTKHHRFRRMADKASSTGPLGVKRSSDLCVAESVAMGTCSGQLAGSTAQVLRQGHLCLAFSGRLDYREDLPQSLLRCGSANGALRRGAATSSDAEIALQAFVQFGIGCVEQFCGDWALAVWDARNERLHLARDATGISEMYWWAGGGQIQFASSMAALLATGSMPLRPDPASLAGLLTVFIDSARPTATAFQDLHILPPGCLLTVTKQSSDMHRWWRPESLGRLYAEPMDRLREQFLEQYRRSVCASLPADGQGVAATLSGGLDSGSVVALAAPELHRCGHRLTAYVHAPRFDPAQEHPSRNGDEWEMALATARHVGHIDARVCRSEHLSPLDGMRQWMDLAVVPSHAMANYYWLLDIARQAVTGGAQCLLVGQAGNSSVSYTGDGNLWPRLRHLQLGTVAAELGSDRAGPWAAFKGRIAKPVLRPAYSAFKRELARRRAPAVWAGYALATPELVQQTRLLAAMRAANHDPSFATQPRAKRDLFRLTLRDGSQNGSAVWSELGRSQGLEIRDPTRDRRLVELCWRLPDEMFWAQGQQRGLIRHAMHDLLPEEVLAATRRGQQSADLRLRLKACAADFLAEVGQVRAHPTVRAWVDVERLWRFANDLTAEGHTGESATDSYLSQHMLRTLAVARFVARHS